MRPGGHGWLCNHYEEVAPFTRQVKFLHTGTYQVFVTDFVSNLKKEVIYTVI